MSAAKTRFTSLDSSAGYHWPVGTGGKRMRVLPYFAPTQRSNDQAVMNADGPLLVRHPQKILRPRDIRPEHDMLISMRVPAWSFHFSRPPTSHHDSELLHVQPNLSLAAE
jgi:hypothetical protein